MPIDYRENYEITVKILAIYGIVEQATTFSLTILLWATVNGFKRVEVQVVQDERETTFAIFKKLKFFRNYQIVFATIVLCFFTPSFILQIELIGSIAEYSYEP